MRSEEVVPMEERYLIVEGHLSAKTRQTVRKGLRKELASSGRVCFVSSAYADLALPKEFDTAFFAGRLESTGKRGATKSGFQAKQLISAVPVRVCIVEVMDTSYQTLAQLPDGAKTVCVLEFAEGVPYMIDDLPTVKDWGESSERVVLCSRETLAALKANSG